MAIKKKGYGKCLGHVFVGKMTIIPGRTAIRIRTKDDSGCYRCQEQMD